MRKSTRITQAYARSRLDYDPGSGLLRWRPLERGDIRDASWNSRYAGKVAGTINAHGYVVLTIEKRTKVLAHRLIWLYVKGVWPKRFIDHRNTIKHDNCWKNLREATVAQNGWNCSRNSRNTSGVRGVSWDKSKRLWMAHIMVRRHVKPLGKFQSKSAAVAARRAAVRKYHGEFAPSLT